MAQLWLGNSFDKFKKTLTNDRNHSEAPGQLLNNILTAYELEKYYPRISKLSL